MLGAGSGLGDDNGLTTNLAANLLNLMLDPQLSRIDTVNRHRVEIGRPPVGRARSVPDACGAGAAIC